MIDFTQILCISCEYKQTFSLNISKNHKKANNSLREGVKQKFQNKKTQETLCFSGRTKD